MKKKRVVFSIISMFILVISLYFPFQQANATITERIDYANLTISITQAIIHEDRDVLGPGEIYIESFFYYHDFKEPLEDQNIPLKSSNKTFSMKSKTISEINDGDRIVWNDQVINISNVTAYLLEVYVKESDNDGDDLLGIISIQREVLPTFNFSQNWYNALESSGGSNVLQAELEIIEKLSDKNQINYQNDDSLTWFINKIISFLPSGLGLVVVLYIIHLYFESKRPPEIRINKE